MTLSNRMYDIGKWMVLIFSPALAVLIGGLGELYHWSDTSTIVTTINIIAVFLGSILQVSSRSYKQINLGGDNNHTDYPKSC